MKIIQVLDQTKSRTATDKDAKRISDAVREMRTLCEKEHALALAHVQVTKDDPLRFYVTVEGNVVINPEIINHTHHTVDHKEGCMSYKHRPFKTVQRWHKCVVSYQSLQMFNHPLVEWKLSPPMPYNMSGIDAKVAQHEVDHMNGKNIYQ